MLIISVLKIMKALNKTELFRFRKINDEAILFIILFIILLLLAEKIMNPQNITERLEKASYHGKYVYVYWNQ